MRCTFYRSRHHVTPNTGSFFFLNHPNTLRLCIFKQSFYDWCLSIYVGSWKFFLPCKFWWSLKIWQRLTWLSQITSTILSKEVPSGWCSTSIQSKTKCIFMQTPSICKTRALKRKKPTNEWRTPVDRHCHFLLNFFSKKTYFYLKWS